MPSLADTVFTRLRALKRSYAQAERIGGLSRNFISDLKTNKSDVLGRNREKLAAALDWSLDEMNNAIAGRQPVDASTSAPPVAPLSPPAAQDLLGDAQFLPVLGVAAGSAIAAFVIGDAVDWVERPPALRRARNAYALFVHGTSMAPKYEHGDIVFVNPDRPYRRGDPVIVQTRHFEGANDQAMIKLFQRVTDKSLMVEMLNPPGTIEIPLSTVMSVHRVMSAVELYL